MQTLFADLVQRCGDADFDARFPETGSITRREHNGRGFFYYTPGGRGDANRKQTYVGPESDPEVVRRVEGFKASKTSFKDRRSSVVALQGAGLPRPAALTGDVIEALWKAGFFRFRGVLVGTEAFQTYSGILGVRFEEAYTRTTDADFAQFHSVSRLIGEGGDEMPPMLEVLRGVDPTFTEVPSLDRAGPPAAFKNEAGYRVEFLTPNQGSEGHARHPARMPALGGAGAMPLRYLDFLIHNPIQSVLLHKGGVHVTVPAPQRYAVHKLIVATQRRQDSAKATKDVIQSGVLIEAMNLAGRGFDLTEAWLEAWGRGPKWRTNLTNGLHRLEKLSPAGHGILKDMVFNSAVTFGVSPSACWPAKPTDKGDFAT